jgi:Uma2 family endonuclease
MSALSSKPKRMTTEEFLDLPDDGIERFLVDGELVEMGDLDDEVTMTVRNPDHGAAESRISFLLWKWLAGQKAPKGKVLAGETGFILKKHTAIDRRD